MLRAWTRVARRGLSTATAPAIPNWERMFNRCTTDEEKQGLQALRTEIQEMQQKITEAEKPAPKLDWTDWEGKIAAEGVVKEFKAAYEASLSSQKPADFHVAIDEEGQAKQIKELETALEQVAAEIKECQTQIGYFEKLKQGISTATLDTERERNPELLKKIDEEIENDNWKF